MAIKDWKKISIKRNSLNKSLSKWAKGNKVVSIEKYMGGWITSIYTSNGNSKDKLFKTKTKALAYAKAYMRKH